jgi:hypothetical protein
MKYIITKNRRNRFRYNYNNYLYSLEELDNSKRVNLLMKHLKAAGIIYNQTRVGFAVCTILGVKKVYKQDWISIKVLCDEKVFSFSFSIMKAVELLTWKKTIENTI